MKYVLFWSALLCCGVVQAENLGRLFFSPEQRVQLDHARRTMPMQTGESTTAPSAPDYTLKGVVTRSDGQRSVWLNDQLRHESGNTHAQERNRVQVPVPGGSVQLRVGQTFNPDSGKVVESFRRPSPETPPASKPEAKVPTAKKPLVNSDVREDAGNADKIAP